MGAGATLRAKQHFHQGLQCADPDEPGHEEIDGADHLPCLQSCTTWSATRTVRRHQITTSPTLT